METTVRVTRRMDELKKGDWLASDQVSGADGLPVEVADIYPFADAIGAAVLLVYRTPTGQIASIVGDGGIAYELATEDEVRQSGEQADRDKFIAGLHEFADWLKANPWAPIKRDSGYLQTTRLQVDLHGADMDAGLAAVERVRKIASRLGVEADEKLDDRTDASIEIGSVSYSVIAWHRDGRPAEPKPLVDPDASMEAHYDAEADAQAYLGEMHAKADEVRAARADAAQRGLLFSRDDDEADDPTPVSPARVPAHVGALTENGLVDETSPTPVGPDCPDCHGCGTPPGGQHATACGVRPWARR